MLLSHSLCRASHSIQSRCSISFPYPIPSHRLSSNRFKSAFAARAVIPCRSPSLLLQPSQQDGERLSKPIPKKILRDSPIKLNLITCFLMRGRFVESDIDFTKYELLLYNEYFRCDVIMTYGCICFKGSRVVGFIRDSFA